RRRRRNPRPRTPTSRSCPESCAILGLHPLEGLANSLLDAGRLLLQVPQLAKTLHPFGLAGAGRATSGRELFLQGFAHELLERLAAFGGLGLGLAEEDVRNLDGRLHDPYYHIYGDRGWSGANPQRISGVTIEGQV